MDATNDTDLATRTPNRYERGMAYGGGALLLLGLLLVVTGRQAIRSAEFVAQLGGAGDTAGPAAGFWIGVVLGVVGAVMLLAVLVIRAARPSSGP